MTTLQIKNLEFSYGPTSPILSGINCNFDAGQSILIIGDNGSGKTTFGRLLAGLIKPDSGSYFINGISPAVTPPAERCKITSYIQQVGHLSILGSSVRNELYSYAIGTDKLSLENIYIDFAEKHSLPKNLECNPRDLSNPDLWRVVVCFYAYILDPFLLIIDEIPCPSNKLQISLLSEIVKIRRNKNQITILLYQRRLTIPFDAVFLLEDKQLNILKHV